MVEIVPAVAVKVVEVAPTGTVIEAGTLSAAALLERETVVPLPGAALEMLTVQVVVALDARVVGLQVKEETVMTGAVRLIEAVDETPLRVAVRITV